MFFYLVDEVAFLGAQAGTNFTLYLHSTYIFFCTIDRGKTCDQFVFR